jgi:triosephosphate isomerase
MYFEHHQTLNWCKRISQIAASHPAITKNHAQLFILPSLPSISSIGPVLSSVGIGFGAQNMCHEDRGAFTGEVGGPLLRELGCDYVEIGHAERRRLFGETEKQIAEKISAAIRNELTPVLCVGEEDLLSVDEAVKICISQISSAVSLVQGAATILVAYEPIWAIGAKEPASKEHIIGVCEGISEILKPSKGLSGSRVIYGGSAGPGLLTKLNGRVAGMFLGRFVHDAENLVKILDEIESLQPTIARSA